LFFCTGKSEGIQSDECAAAAKLVLQQLQIYFVNMFTKSLNNQYWRYYALLKTPIAHWFNP
jgi:hypothetical protein